MEKSLPQSYRDKNKEFMQIAWRLRMVKGVQTRIICRDHLIILQMKSPDQSDSKFQWTIVREWFPKQSLALKPQGKPQEGLKPTQPLTALDKSKVLVSDLPDLSPEEIKDKFSRFIEEGDRGKIKEIVHKGKCAVVSLTTIDEARKFVKKYAGKTLSGSKLTLYVCDI